MATLPHHHVPVVQQFDYNSDFPAATAAAADPLDFPPAAMIPCARITTRVYHPLRNEISTVQNVLVKTRPPPVLPNRRGEATPTTSSTPTAAVVGMMMMDANTNNKNGGGGGNFNNNDDDWSDDSSWSSDDDDDDDDGGDDDDDMDIVGSSSSTSASAMAATTSDDQQQQQQGEHQQQQGEEERAYWLQRTLREAIYGRVRYAVVLRRRNKRRGAGAPGGDNSTVVNAEWEVTGEQCAVKEMSWQHIRRERDRLAEDPIKEVSAMQHLKLWNERRRQQQQLQLQQGNNNNNVIGGGRLLGNDPNDVILESNIMVPLDVLSDDRHLYCIMPFCDGGELFDRLDQRERFTEQEARYWMHQILNGVENLQHAGICHRDMSLENLLVHRNTCLVIDMGMCLRIPYADPKKALLNGMTNSFQGMSMDKNVPVAASATTTTSAIVAQQQQQQQQLLQQQPHIFPDMNNDHDTLVSGKYRPRLLMKPQGTCGKWHYMSPEIVRNLDPFDGFAVDMWATGVILFLMLTGFPPWERASPADERFKFMTAGFLVQMLTEWELGLSPDAMDLLQRMLWLDPRDRLSLEQVRAHPWMVNGPAQAPGP